MCGICGIFNFRNSKSQLEAVKKMTDEMDNRGPDDEGIVSFSENYKVKHILGGINTPKNVWESSLPFTPKKTYFNEEITLALGHRRLSIIELSAKGHQPLCSKNQRYWIVFNGEIYNYLDLKKQLISSGFTFYGNSDTEVLINGFIKWGKELLIKLDGMFAFAIYDSQKKEIFFARDRVGIKPLYYSLQKNKILFASDIKTLLASDLVKKEINIEGLYHCFSFGVTPRPDTIFSEIKSLDKATWMIINNQGKVTQKSYWEIPINTVDYSLTEKQAVKLLDESLHKAVKKRLLSDVPVATFMSGGVDSTTMTAIASLYNSGINAYTIGFKNEPKLNEVNEAKAVSNKYSINHIIDYVDSTQVLKKLQDIVRCYEEPKGFIDPQYLLSKTVSEHKIKVTLNGLGADELFGGYNYHRWIKKWYLARFLKPIISPFQNTSTFSQKLYDVAKCSSIIDFNTINWSYLTEKSKQSIFKKAVIKDFNTIDKVKQLYFSNQNFSSNMEALEFIDFNNYLSNHFLYRSDQFLMRFSLEGRFPFLDNELIDLSFKIPAKMKVKGDIGKYILKKTAEKYIPKKNIYKKKKGFRFPLKRWMKYELSAVIEEKIENLQNREYFDSDGIKEKFDKYKKNRIRFSEILQLVMTEIWFEEFID